jgi:hypothetical protein
MRTNQFRVELWRLAVIAVAFFCLTIKSWADPASVKPSSVSAAVKILEAKPAWWDLKLKNRYTRDWYARADWRDPNQVHALMVHLKQLNACNTSELRAAITEYYAKNYDRSDPFSDQSMRVESNIYVLNRFVFAIPQGYLPRPFIKGWIIPPQKKRHTWKQPLLWNLLWPFDYSAPNTLTLDYYPRFYGGDAGRFEPLAEFDYFNSQYGRRWSTSRK